MVVSVFCNLLSFKGTLIFEILGIGNDVAHVRCHLLSFEGTSIFEILNVVNNKKVQLGLGYYSTRARLQPCYKGGNECI
jgi:hypothetical protein